MRRYYFLYESEDRGSTGCISFVAASVAKAYEMFEDKFGKDSANTIIDWHSELIPLKDFTDDPERTWGK